MGGQKGAPETNGAYEAHATQVQNWTKKGVADVFSQSIWYPQWAKTTAYGIRNGHGKSSTTLEPLAKS
eukprot:893141-Pelagomonas_calceolata.AAC.4